jgi:hypothetical protein
MVTGARQACCMCLEDGNELIVIQYKGDKKKEEWFIHEKCLNKLKRPYKKIGCLNPDKKNQ